MYLHSTTIICDNCGKKKSLPSATNPMKIPWMNVLVKDVYSMGDLCENYDGVRERVFKISTLCPSCAKKLLGDNFIGKDQKVKYGLRSVLTKD